MDGPTLIIIKLRFYKEKPYYFDFLCYYTGILRDRTMDNKFMSIPI